MNAVGWTTPTDEAQAQYPLLRSGAGFSFAHPDGWASATRQAPSVASRGGFDWGTLASAPD